MARITRRRRGGCGKCIAGGAAPVNGRGLLGIKRGHTPGCQYFLSQFAARQAHAEGVRQFHEVFRADGGELVSEKKAFTIVQEVTEGLERQRQQEVDNYLQIII